MLPNIPEKIIDRIRNHALRHITERQQTSTNLSLDSRIYKAGDTIGPKFQGIRAEGPTVIVFADDKPLANFGHPCRYLLYHPETGEFLKEVPARFPPSLVQSANRLTLFLEPVTFRNPIPYWYFPPIYRCPRLRPVGNRYAILYSGLTQGRHLNDMEFAYRTLVDVYGFSAANIYVLNYDGTLKVWDITLGKWPGNNTPYTIQVTGKGTRAAFQAAFSDLSSKIQSDDLLFIHTNNHGDYDTNVNDSFLCAWVNDVTNPAPNTDGDFTYYYASQFATDLAVLPAYRALVVLMEQCNSGGFNTPILNSSTAASTSVSSAATSSLESSGTSDGNWDVFAKEWIAAVNGANPDGSALASNPDTNHDGVVDTQEAYNYAVSQDNVDTPAVQRLHQRRRTHPRPAIRVGVVLVFYFLACLQTDLRPNISAGHLSATAQSARPCALLCDAQQRASRTSKTASPSDRARLDRPTRRSRPQNRSHPRSRQGLISIPAVQPLHSASTSRREVQGIPDSMLHLNSHACEIRNQLPKPASQVEAPLTTRQAHIRPRRGVDSAAMSLLLNDRC
jgi:hypothetical protein